MTRIPNLALENLTSAQRKAFDIIVASRSPGTVTDAQAETYKNILGTTEQKFNLGGPFTAFLQSPEFAVRTTDMAKFLRFESSLSPRQVELAIIVTARFWTAQYEWYAHAKFAAMAGVEEEIIQAIKENRRPDFTRADDETIYTFCQQLHIDHQVSDKTYQDGIALLGEQGIVELIGLIGFYTMVSMTLNTIKVAVPAGEELPPI
jgi:4-carboxymuconolactone decarboxylase